MKRTIFFFTLLFCSTWAHAQTLLERIVDSALIKERHEAIMSKLDSAYCWPDTICPFDSKDLIIYDVYWINYASEESNFVVFDTNKFNKNYFVSGKFLDDWYNIKEQENIQMDNLLIHEMHLFDTVNDKAYFFYEHTHEIQSHFSFDNFLGKLFKSKTIDYVLYFPTFVTHYDSSIIDEPDMYDSVFISLGTIEKHHCFALKENHFFFIDLVNEKIYPMEEVVENHWDWITNVIEKQ